MNARKLRLLHELADPEYRQYYSEQHLNSTLATQISAIREQRGLTQERLATKIGKHQAAISRIENVNYARWNTETLRQVARALGCWLNVRLESWGKLVEDAESYSVEALRRDRFEDDPFFWGSVAEGPVPEPVRWIQKRLLPWLETNSDDQLLLNWLQGCDLPPVGDEDPPYVWIMRAIEVEGPESRHRALLIGWLGRFIPQAKERAALLQQPEEFLIGLFNLAAVFSVPEDYFAEPLRQVYEDLAKEPDSLSESVKAALLSALIRNQGDMKLKSTWLDTIVTGRHPFLPANEIDAFDGLKWLPPRPNLRALAEGLKALQEASWDRPENGIDVQTAMQDVSETFSSFPQLDQFLWREGVDIDWTEPVVAAWVNTFAKTLDDQIRIGRIAYAYPGPLLNEFLTRANVDHGNEEAIAGRAALEDLRMTTAAGL